MVEDRSAFCSQDFKYVLIYPENQPRIFFKTLDFLQVVLSSWSKHRAPLCSGTNILPQSNAQGDGIDEKLCQRLTSKNYPAEAPEGDSK